MTANHESHTRIEALEAVIKLQAWRIEALEAALRLFASDEVWRHNGRCDPNSSNFDGQSIARAALDKDTDK